MLIAGPTIVIVDGIEGISEHSSRTLHSDLYGEMSPDLGPEFRVVRVVMRVVIVLVGGFVFMSRDDCW